MSKDNQKFADKMKELESIVEWFDSDEVDLDQALEKFERGTKLAGELKADISDIENKVKDISSKQ